MTDVVNISKSKSKGQRTKEHIHDCAMKLFSEFGYDNVTIMQICEKACVTKRTFYYHFNSKDDILSEFTSFVGSHAEEMLLSMENALTNVDILWVLLSAYLTDALNKGAAVINRLYISRLQGKEVGQFPTDMYLYNTCVRTIRNAQHEHEIQNMAPAQDIATVLFQALRGASYTWSENPSLRDLEADYKLAFNIILGTNIK